MKVGCNLSLDSEVVRALHESDENPSQLANKLLVKALGLKLPPRKPRKRPKANS